MCFGVFKGSEDGRCYFEAPGGDNETVKERGFRAPTQSPVFLRLIFRVKGMFFVCFAGSRPRAVVVVVVVVAAVGHRVVGDVGV